MEIFFNGVKCSVKENISLFDFLKSKNIADKVGIAVAINNKLIPKAKWSDTVLQADDKIVLIQATCGG